MLMVGGMINAGELRWFVVVPTIGQIINVFQSVLLGVNNVLRSRTCQVRDRPDLGRQQVRDLNSK